MSHLVSQVAQQLQVTLKVLEKKTHKEFRKNFNKRLLLRNNNKTTIKFNSNQRNMTSKLKSKKRILKKEIWKSKQSQNKILLKWWKIDF